MSFFEQSESEGQQNQSRHYITFDTHLKTALNYSLLYSIQMLLQNVAFWILGMSQTHDLPHSILIIEMLFWRPMVGEVIC